MLTLTISLAPITTSAPSDVPNDLESAKTTVATPKTATAENSLTPTRLFGG